MTLVHGDFFNWVLLPLVIMFSRMADVSLGTLRHIFLSKGLKKLVPLLGFIEVLIWIVVVAQIMKNLNNVMCYFAWAAGFSLGTWIGIKLDEKLALGLQLMRVITSRDSEKLEERLRMADLGVTVIEARGAKGPVRILMTIVDRKNLKVVTAIVNEFDPEAFYSVQDIREVRRGVFPEMGSEGFLHTFLSPRK